MALLQISEPGKPSIAGAKKLAVGIDLGTTNSLISSGYNGVVEILPDKLGSELLPSVVYYNSDSAPVVGRPAQTKAKRDPKNTISSVKRLLGRSKSEAVKIAQFKQYIFDSNRDDSSPAIITDAGIKDPIQVSSDILAKLASRASQGFGEPIEGAVITVPAYFNDAQRQQTKQAAKLAGLKVFRLLNEPTAAALAYGLDRNEEENVVVYDLGGGTFDVSILSLRKGIFEVLATGGDTSLGGDDIDHAICAWMGSSGLKIDELNLAEQSELVSYANSVKHQLSVDECIDLEFKGWRASLNRNEFADICRPFVQKTINTCRRVLRDSSLSVKEIDNIVMVGGSTRSLVIREAVEKYFEKSPLTRIDPDKVVAVGAGIQAEVLAGNKTTEDFLLLDVSPLSLGIETMGELVEKIIPRNTTIPVAKAQDFTTFKDGQSVMTIHVVQGERELVSDCRSLAKFELKGIPKMVAGAAKVRVKFQVDADGLLSVMAEELSTQKKAEIQVKPSFGLDSNMVEEILEASYQNANLDMDVRSLKESQLDARQLIESISSAMESDRELLNDTEESRLSAAKNNLSKLLESGTALQIREATEELNRISSEFANRRMDLHMANALKGEKIDKIEND